MKMAQQEMDYRVDLYNRSVTQSRVTVCSPKLEHASLLKLPLLLAAGWLLHATTNVWTKGNSNVMYPTDGQ